MSYLSMLDIIETKINKAAAILGTSFDELTPEEFEIMMEISDLLPHEKDYLIRSNYGAGTSFNKWGGLL
mgnify:CR=1 FL=1